MSYSRSLLGRTAVAAAVLAAPLAVGTGAASAHTEVVRTSPGTGKTASTTTRTVLVTFSGEIRKGGATLRVTGPDRKVVSVGRGGRDARNVKRLRVTLKRGLKPGRYTARWTAVAADGHPQKGTFSFRLKRR